jgi:hypothetical protein
MIQKKESGPFQDVREENKGVREGPSLKDEEEN